MSEQDLATTDRGLSTADLASAAREPESVRADREGRENSHDEFDTDGHDDVRDESYGDGENLRDDASESLPDEGRESLRDEFGESLPDEGGEGLPDDGRENLQDEGRENLRDERRENLPDDAAPQLFKDEDVTGYRDRWQSVQTGFVDDPHQAVQEADELVAAVISALATSFAEHKSELEAQWRQGEPATEELRIALRRYRAFFDQLLPH